MEKLYLGRYNHMERSQLEIITSSRRARKIKNTDQAHYPVGNGSNFLYLALPSLRRISAILAWSWQGCSAPSCSALLYHTSASSGLACKGEIPTKLSGSKRKASESVHYTPKAINLKHNNRRTAEQLIKKGSICSEREKGILILLPPGRDKCREGGKYEKE